MSNLKNYRAIGISDENGVMVSTMMVHSCVSDETVKKLMRRHQYEIMHRLIEEKIEKNGEATGAIHVVHRLNLLKKLVRLNDEMNGFVREYQNVITGQVYDCKDFKKRNCIVTQRELAKLHASGDVEHRVIETQEEVEFYGVYGHTYMEPVKREKVYFVDTPKTEGALTCVPLYSEMENCV